ncbi:MAG: DUF4255 domain-containing protein [Terriglobia bacterium]
MPLIDLSLVTTTLTNLITQWMKQSPLKASLTKLDVSPLSPDRLKGDQTVGLYLYSVEENAQYKNVDSPSPDPLFPERYIPMGLNLYYQLTAHSDVAGDPAAIQEQTLMGLAMKALHDYPRIDDSIVVGGAKVFPLDLQGTDNMFRVSLQPVPFTDAMQYWNAGNQPLRLAAYYQVTPVLLEPEKPDSLRGRVLRYGVFSFVRGAPHIDASQATVQFQVPGETTPRNILVQPAEGPVGGKITFLGTELSADSTTLLLSHASFPEPIEVGPDWGVLATASQITATIQPNAQISTVVPGVYSARARVADTRVLPDGSTRAFANLSNAIPFLVTPNITAISLPVGGTITVTGGVFKNAAIAVDAVQILLGGNVLQPKGAGPLAAGQFDVTSATTIDFKFPASGFVSGAQTMLRIIINGAENSPVWVPAP